MIPKFSKNLANIVTAPLHELAGKNHKWTIKAIATDKKGWSKEWKYKLDQPKKIPNGIEWQKMPEIDLKGFLRGVTWTIYLYCDDICMLDMTGDKINPTGTGRFTVLWTIPYFIHVVGEDQIA